MHERASDLIRGLTAAARPFVRRLLAAGTPYAVVEEAMRKLFVEIADKDLSHPDRPATDSHVSLRTGIHRKEVKRLRSMPKGPPLDESLRVSPLASLVSRWTSDSSLVDRAGKPIPLPYDSPRGPSFRRLARQVTDDLAPRVLLDELLRSGAARVTEDRQIHLERGSFVPRTGDPEQRRILVEDPPELIETVLRNVLEEDEAPLLQRKVYYDNLGRDGAKKIRAELRREGEKFLRRINRSLARHDRDRNPKAAGGEPFYASVGVYVFESKAAEAPVAAEAPRRFRRRKKPPTTEKKA